MPRAIALGTVLLLVVAAGSPAAYAEESASEAEQLREEVRQLREEMRALKEALGLSSDPIRPAALTPAGAGPSLAPAAVAPVQPAILPAPAPSTPGATPAPLPGELPGVRSGQPLFGNPVGGGIRWGGYLTLEYVANSKKNSFFDLHRFVLDLQTQISDCIDLSAEIEIEHGGIGGGADGDVEIEHADVVFRVADCFNPKLGALLIPFGRYNKYHEDPYNDFTKRPWTARYMVPTGFGQPGIGVEGVFGLGDVGRLSYDVALTNGFKDDFTPSGGIRGGRQRWQQDSNESKQVWGRLAFARDSGCLDYFEAGLSGTWSRYDDDDDNDLYGFGADVLMRKGPFEFKGEYFVYDFERDALDPADAVRGQSALWLEGAYHFFPCGWRKCRNCFITPTSLFTLAVRYQTMDLDDRRTGAAFNDDLVGWGVALNYRLTERTIFRFDYSWFDAENDPDEEEFTASFSTIF